MSSVTETQVVAHRFGNVAQSLNLVTAAQVEAALLKQRTLRATGGKSRLGEVLILMNVLTVEQVKKVLSEQRKRRQADADKALPMERFGDYKLLMKLGEGGMGAVYKAEDVLAGRLVALKVLRKDLAANSTFVERFSREAKLAGSLSHPNIVTCHNAGTSHGVQFLVMEFVEGETLKVRLQREGKLPEKEALHIVRDVALGLAHAHSKGIIHRDIK
ncbi:MAG: serine/threonine-protein kinase, partial [Planctomycetota bacterium]|nr:serine/threonine-protein kinase [Planctomycetota bacterium]